MHEIVNPDDVGMRQFQAALRLTFKLIQRRTILDHQVGKKFQRDIALQFFVARQPHNPHSASAEDLDQRVAAKDFLAAGSIQRCLDKTTRAAPSGRRPGISVPHLWQTLIRLFTGAFLDPASGTQIHVGEDPRGLVMVIKYSLLRSKKRLNRGAVAQRQPGDQSVRKTLCVSDQF